MINRINIILCFLLIFAINNSNAQDNFSVFVPENIQSGNNFEISFITSNEFKDADRLNIFISTDISLIMNKVDLLTAEKKLQLSFQSEFVDEYSQQFHKISIDLADTLLFSDGSFFQIIINLKSSRTKENDLSFFGEFLYGEEIIGYLVNSEINVIPETNYLYHLSFNYYQNYSIAGNALSLQQGSYLNIPLTNSFDKILSVDFWMKIKNPVSRCIEIINGETNMVAFHLSVNENQLLIFNSQNNNLLTVKTVFVSQNVWYHFNINFEKENSEVSFYCDGDELASLRINNELNFENMIMRFQNKKQNSEINLEQLRVINSEEMTTAVNRNKNYIDYSDDQSNVILQLNFNNDEMNNHLNNKVVSFDRIRYVNSEAPIFPRSPEINIKFSDNYYEIEWEGGSYKDAFKYVLERANGSDDFIEIGEVAANNNNESVYSILSEKIEQTEIIYFRIKQVNKDGTIIYSDVTKVGQGIVDDVILGQNYPNPFNPTTLIEFELIQDSDVEVKVYNLAGKEISVLHEGFLSKGIHQFEFDGSGLSSGLYFYQITTPLTSQTRKMILAK